jgi:LuxR family maltose regulon positive regulatory protein
MHGSITEYSERSKRNFKAIFFFGTESFGCGYGGTGEADQRLDRGAATGGTLDASGQVYVLMGKLEDGRRSFEEALVAGPNLSAEGNWVLCRAQTSLAEVLLERADLAGATEHVAKALEFTAKSPTRSPGLHARTTAAQVFLAAGDIKTARNELEQAQAFVRGSSDSRYVSFLSSVQLKFYCQIEDFEAAADVVRDRNLSPNTAVDRNNEEEMTAFARYLVACGDYNEAEQVLAKVLPLVRSIGRVQHEIHALVLQVMANELLGERALALESLGRATFLGEPARFNRTFTSEGPMIIELMEALVDAVQSRRGGSPAEVGSSSYLAYLLREKRSKPVTASALVEPLTAREVEILRLIAAGMRNQEIADHLFISLHTVKRHIANAYAKLGVTHRTEALARANELKLV